MDQESIVYGCIKDINMDRSDMSGVARRRVNRDVMLSLPNASDWPFLCQEMFAIPSETPQQNGYLTEVMHFGASYRAIEYEWEQWIEKFEAMLQQMYWVSATVHLETELSGTHTFTWESGRHYHEPHCGDLHVRCEWSQEGAIL